VTILPPSHRNVPEQSPPLLEGLGVRANYAVGVIVLLAVVAAAGIILRFFMK
jgi:hypothetical protein